ncbi:MAG TPA: CARDB domain-containing protein [Candidatus Thermoplasmatota archaeon]|nr:CARDB domain-containing protein [Candidatus Thermoplasmatota archaeon]
MRAVLAAAVLLVAMIPAAGATAEPKLPDLTISDIAYRWILTKREPYEPDPLNQATLAPATNRVEVNLTVTNLGNANATDVRVLIVFGVGVTLSANPNIGTVLAGQSVQATVVVSVPAPQYCFKVDGHNTIAESNEANNDGGCHLIEGADLVGFA